MKRKIGRELLLISLPLRAIGGAAWLFAGGGRTVVAPLVPALDNGLARLVFSSFEAASVTPYDVYKGYEWSATTKVSERGKFGTPASWKRWGTSVLWSPDMRLVCRKGDKWQQVRHDKGVHWYTTNQNLDTNVVTVKVDLTGVPADADEVRLRGRFDGGASFRGPIPPGWKSPLKVKHAGLNHYFDLASQPFDFAVKTPDQALPNPQVARVPDLEFVAAGWYYKPNIYEALVRLRKYDRGRKWSNLSILSYSLRDGDGKEIVFVDDKGKPRKTDSFIYRHDFPQLSKDEAIFEFAGFASEPKGGWSNVKQPVTLDAQVSDRTSWPLRIHATLSLQLADSDALAQVEPARR